MTLTTSILTGRLPFPDDSVPANAYLRFTLSGVDTDGADVLHPASRTVALVSGEIPAGFELWQNVAGLLQTFYNVELVVIVSDNFGAMTQERAYTLGKIQIGSAASYDLSALLVVPTAGLDVETYIAQIMTAVADAHIAADTASESAGIAEAAALAAGAPIVSVLTSPVPANGTIELLKTVNGLAVYEVVTGAWVSRGGLAVADYVTAITSANGLAYTATTGYNLPSLVAGMTFIFTPNMDSAGAVTIAVDGLPARTLADRFGTALVSGMLKAGVTYQVIATSPTALRLVNDARTQRGHEFLATNAFLVERAGLTIGRFATTANNEIAFSGYFSGALSEIWRSDTSGAVRFVRAPKIGATAGAAVEIYHPGNKQPVVVNYADAYATADIATAAGGAEFADQHAPYALTTGAGWYFLNGGDTFRPINVSATDGKIDLTFAPIGRPMMVYTTGSGVVQFYAGAGTTFVGQASNVTHLTYTDGSVLEVTRLSQSSVFIDQKAGSAPTTSTAAPATRSQMYATMGQSNGVKKFTEGGLAGWQERRAELGATADVWLVQGASGQSSLFGSHVVSGTNYWIDDTGAYAPGPLLTAFVAAINAARAAPLGSQPALRAVFLDHGENVVAFMAASGSTTFATVVSAYEYIISYVRTQLGNATLPFIITPLGANDTAANEAATTSVREALLKVIANDANVHQGAERYDLPRPANNVHLNYAGQRIEGRRMADVVDRVLDSGTADLGPAIVGFTELTATTFRVDVDPFDGDGGTSSLANADNPIEAVGFALLPPGPAVAGAGPYAISGIVRSFNAGTGNHEFTITTTASATGARLCYPYGAMRAQRTGRIVKGTISGLPLRCYSTGL